MKVPLLDLRQQYKLIKKEIMKVTEELFEKQYFILGPSVETLEEEISSYCTSKYAVGVSSGTDAILISLMAAGIGPKDGVITTPYTFFSTAGAITRLGARPIFVDIDPDTFNLSPEHLVQTLTAMDQTERERIRAIIPVHLYGQCADMDPILKIAEDYDLVVIEDAAQAIGAEYGGRRAGSMGDYGCFSFFPSKNLGAFGDGGAVTTNSKALDEKLRILRDHGAAPTYYHRVIWGNFRVGAGKADIMSVKRKYLDGWTKMRQKNAKTYKQLFKKAGLERQIQLPIEKENRHIYNQFVIRVAEKRDLLRQFLLSEEIGSEVYYPLPLHLQECFSYLNYPNGAFPVAEHAASHSLALPIYPELTENQLAYVVEKIKIFF